MGDGIIMLLHSEVKGVAACCSRLVEAPLLRPPLSLLLCLFTGDVFLCLEGFCVVQYEVVSAPIMPLSPPLPPPLFLRLI